MISITVYSFWKGKLGIYKGKTLQSVKKKIELKYKNIINRTKKTLHIKKVPVYYKIAKNTYIAKI